MRLKRRTDRKQYKYSPYITLLEKANATHVYLRHLIISICIFQRGCGALFIINIPRHAPPPPSLLQEITVIAGYLQFP